MIEPQLAFDLVRPVLQLEQLCNDEEQLVACALDWGKSRAKQIEDLAGETQMKSRRVQEVVQHLLFDHSWPIGTSMSEPFGNYLIDSAAELEQTVELLRSRGISNLARAAALKKMSVMEYLKLIQYDLQLERAS